jgi:hypothetical protein
MASKGSFGDAPWLLFLFSPIGAALASFRNIRSLWSRNVFWAFVVFYGATFAVAAEDSKSKDTQSDIHRYREQVEDLYILELDYNEIKKLYAENEDVDVLRLTIAIFVSRFTKSQQTLTFIYALIYGFFLSRNLWFVFGQLRGKLKPSVKFLLGVLFLIIPMWFINGFRFWTAAHIFIYGSFIYLLNKRTIGIIIAALSILVHFSFIFPTLTLLLFPFIRSRLPLIFILYLTSLLFSQINLQGFNSFLEQNTSERLQNRTKSYRDEGRVEAYRKGELDQAAKTANWYVQLYLTGFFWTMRIMMVFMYLRMRRYIGWDPRLYRLFAFSLLFFSLSNFLSSIPSGQRWLYVASFYAMTCLLILRQNNVLAAKKMNWILVGTFPFVLLFFVVSSRIGFYSLSVNTFVGNPFTAFFTDYNISLNDLLKPS